MTARITAPGVYEIPADVYHADDLMEQPTLSSGVLKTLVNHSPAHARAAHPRLNPDREHADSEKFDLGRAAHDLLLEGAERFRIIDADDWRTKAAKEARDAARRDGLTPLLKRQYDEAKVMVAAARWQMARHPDLSALMLEGKPEQTLIWQEDDGFWCRIRLDWMPSTGAVFFDYKSTGGSAEPNDWARTAYENGADIQAVFYMRGIRKLLGVEPVFKFIVQENYAPYALSVCEISPMGLDLAYARMVEGLKYWGQCLKANRWPGYRAQVAYIDPPAWVVKAQEIRSITAQMDKDAGFTAADRALEGWTP